MQVLGSRRGGVAVIAIAVLAIAALAALAALQYAGRASIAAASPSPGSAVPTRSPVLAVDIENADRLGDLRVTVDGRDVTATAGGNGDRLVITPGALADGAHTAEVRFTTRNVFSRTVSRKWTFDVDTTRPKVAVTKPARGALSAKRQVRFAGTAEGGARVAVSWPGGDTSVDADATGRWSTNVRLPEGRVAARITASDRAGNQTAVVRRVGIDTTAPKLQLSVPAKGVLTETDEPLFRGTVPSDDPATLVFAATVNGRRVPAIAGAAAGGAQALEVAGYAAAGPSLVVDGHAFTLGIGSLAQGTNAVTVAVRDKAGNVARRTVKVTVDTTDDFGASEMVKGARGGDVVTLQERLKGSRHYKGKATGRFDAKTEAAVRRYQKKHGFTANGKVNSRVLQAMVGRIVVDTDKYKLRLIRDGKVVKTYPIAVGQSAYPTPVGKFKIVNKQTNPTWIPPNSPWAKGLGPIPPGPGNPLGTRWMGTSADAVGIHGTYADSSIGTRASHGCIRMHIKDVEALYEEVAVGMPVIIR